MIRHHHRRADAGRNGEGAARASVNFENFFSVHGFYHDVRIRASLRASKRGVFPGGATSSSDFWKAW
jgi:hypothetical protein